MQTWLFCCQFPSRQRCQIVHVLESKDLCEAGSGAFTIQVVQAMDAGAVVLQSER